MPKKGSHLNKHKVTPKPKLAAIIGKKPVSYGEAASSHCFLGLLLDDQNPKEN